MLHQAKLEIFKSLFSGIAEEMGVVLSRSAYSPNIKERLDFSCALFDPQGQMIAQAAHIPVHLGSMPLSVAAALEQFTLNPGDTVIVNDPYQGGTHLPDITAVTPAYFEGRLIGFVANRAHHADIGGSSVGSMGLATEIVQEGVRIPPIKLYKKGVLDDDVMRLLMANVRVPDERQGDLLAQYAANRRGVTRLVELAAKYGPDETIECMAHLLDYTEATSRHLIRTIPDGRYTACQYIEDDGHGNGPLPIQVTIEITDDHATIDFEGTASQTSGPLNCPMAVTQSAVAYVFLCLIGVDNLLPNQGVFRPLTIVAPPGSLVNASFPAAVAGGNVETSQRIVDTLLAALAPALPDQIPAASCGTMNNLVIGGVDPRRGSAFSYYETMAGGMGAHANGPGLSAVQTHMTNTKNTPVEALEHAYPLRVQRVAINDGSGGSGRFRGGDGIVREIEVLAPCHASLLTERRTIAPYGLHGGQPGATGKNVLIQKNGAVQTLPGKVEIDLQAGDVLRIETPGGGGFGAFDRD